jgi:Double zinc ribbon
MLEMYRRDQFRQDLLVERCDELIALDERIQAVDTLLAAAVSSRRAAPPARCTCGAPLVWGSHFCANCGRPAGARPPVVACAQCGSALAADAKFCAVCGTPVGPEQQSQAAAVGPSPELLEALPTPPTDPWDT